MGVPPNGSRAFGKTHYVPATLVLLVPGRAGVSRGSAPNILFLNEARPSTRAAWRLTTIMLPAHLVSSSPKPIAPKKVIPLLPTALHTDRASAVCYGYAVVLYPSLVTMSLLCLA